MILSILFHLNLFPLRRFVVKNQQYANKVKKLEKAIIYESVYERFSINDQKLYGKIEIWTFSNLFKKNLVR